MEPSDLIKLHKERKICSTCQGRFYGREYLTYFRTCQRRHVLHQRCLLLSVFKSKDKKDLRCGECRREWQSDDIIVVKMPNDVLPSRLDGGDSPPGGSPPALPRCPLAPLILEPGNDPPNDTLPNDDRTFCTNCGEFLKPGCWRLVEPTSSSFKYSKAQPYGVHCVLCLLSSTIKGFPREPLEQESTPEYTNEQYTDEDYSDDDSGAEEYCTDDEGRYWYEHGRGDRDDSGEHGEYSKDDRLTGGEEEEVLNGNNEIEENNSRPENHAEEKEEDVCSDRREREEDKSDD